MSKDIAEMSPAELAEEISIRYDCLKLAVLEACGPIDADAIVGRAKIRRKHWPLNPPLPAPPKEG